MVGFFEIVVIAATAQLAVLPGEKVQFLIAGLSTRYHPAVVVSAAGASFAGWTALEIWFGNRIQEALSPLYLDLITAGLFLLFAVLLFRSAPATGAELEPATDGGVAAVEEFTLPVVDVEVPQKLGGFVPIFLMMATGEFGDKTQLVTIALAVQYGASPAIWFGEMLAIIPVSLANAYFFSTFAHRFDVRKAHYAGAAVFAFFGLDTLLALTTGFSAWEALVETISAAILLAAA
jgi:putative Ca2+/H+ antiporter (TMEM165/GDT1 family)